MTLEPCAWRLAWQWCLLEWPWTLGPPHSECSGAGLEARSTKTGLSPEFIQAALQPEFIGACLVLGSIGMGLHPGSAGNLRPRGQPGAMPAWYLRLEGLTLYWGALKAWQV
jgi:hypothetical protein